MIKDDDYSDKGGDCNIHSNCNRGEIIIRQLYVAGIEWRKTRAPITLTPLSQQFNQR
jgi:hypothetical protein